MLNTEKELKFIEDEVRELTKSICRQIMDGKYKEVKTTADVMVSMLNNHSRNVPVKNDFMSTDRTIDGVYEDFYVEISSELNSSVIPLIKNRMKTKRKECNIRCDMREYRDLEISYSKLLNESSRITSFALKSMRSQYVWSISVDVDLSHVRILPIGKYGDDFIKVGEIVEIASEGTSQHDKAISEILNISVNGHIMPAKIGGFCSN